MSMNGVSLYALKNEMQEKLLNARIDKIYQENRDIIIYLRNKGENMSLYFCFSADNPAFYLTKNKFDNPKEPPMFTMLLRKYLTNGKISGIRQIGLDRVISIDFDTAGDVFDLDKVSLNFEIMGKYSNLILYETKSGNILDALIRVYPDMSSVRLVLPKEEYTLPVSDKKNILKMDFEDIKKVLEENALQPLSKSLYRYFEGFSPDIVLDILFKLNLDENINYSSLYDTDKNRVVDEIIVIKNRILNNDFTPTVLLKDDKPFRILPFDTPRPHDKKIFDSMNDAVKFFYENRAFLKLQTSRIHELEKKIKNKVESLERALANNKKDMLKASDRESIKLKADLLAANIYKIKKGDKKIIVNNFYSEDNAEITLNIDETLSPKQNVDKMYNKYTKLKNTEEVLKKRIPHIKNEIYYLNSVLLNLRQTETIDEISAIRKELIDGGYFKVESKKKIREPKLKFREFKSPSGLVVRAGRNNIQNDELTNKLAHKSDLWFHLRNEPGTHVILSSANETVTEEDIVYCASLAAALSGKTIKSDIDYTEVKNVKKIPGAKPGLVTYKDFKTITVEPIKL